MTTVKDSTRKSSLSDGTLAQIYDGSTTRLYVGDMVFTRTGTSGTPVLESAAWEGGRLINGSGTGNLLYYVTDHLGSVRAVKDGAGTIRQRYDYYPFGTVSRVYTSSSTTDYSLKRYRFGGKEIAGSALTELGGSGAAPAAPYLDFGARLYSPRTATWLSVDPMAEKYYGIGPHVYCAASPLNLVDPDGRSTWVTIDGEGRYRVEGGEFDDDLNVYFGHYEGEDFIKEYSIGTTAFSTSFYNADSKKWAKGSIIDLQDSSAQSFINNIVETRPEFFPYMMSARSNHVNDFKVSNGIEGRTDFDPYRGMVLGGAIVSGRDIGNIAAGYVAGINGIPFLEMRLMFDVYQTYTNTLHYNEKTIERNPINYYPVIVPSIESKSSRLPQRAGWVAGDYARTKMR